MRAASTKGTRLHVEELPDPGSCADLWRAYNKAVQERTQEEVQIYVNRQKELAAQQATAPLQQQIASLNSLINDQQEKIKNLQQQMQADATAALQAKADAHSSGLKWGAGIGVVGVLLLLGLALGIKILGHNYSLTKKPMSSGAPS